MSYRYLEDITVADIAFEAEGSSLQELFQLSAVALTNAMVSYVDAIDQSVIKCFDIEAPNVEMLLYHFLQELIFYKDAEHLLFSRFDITIKQKTPLWHLSVRVFGEEIDAKKHELLADVKAVSFHRFSVQQSSNGWVAKVVIDV